MTDPLRQLEDAELAEMEALLATVPDLGAGPTSRGAVGKLANPSAFKPSSPPPVARGPPTVPARDYAKSPAQASKPSTPQPAQASKPSPQPKAEVKEVAPPQSPRAAGGGGDAKDRAAAALATDAAVLRLEKLKQLYERGLVDKDEYHARRAVLLDEILAPNK